MKSKRTFLQRIILTPHLLWTALFIIVPLLMIAWYAFTDANGNFSLAAFNEIFTSRDNYPEIFGNSILYALIATVICLIIAYPLAYIISRTAGTKQSVMIMLVMLPMWMNLLLRTYALKVLLEDNGIINSLLAFIGVNMKLIDTPAAVVYGMVYNFLPYMILPIYTVMSKLDKSLIEAAEDLGCNRIEVLKKVIFPQSVSGIISGVTMVFVPSVTTFYISQKLNSSEMLIGDKIQSLFIDNLKYNVGAAVSMILMVLIIICIVVMNKYADDDAGGLVV